MKFGAWLDQEKRLRKVRQGQVAKKLGWSQPKVSTIANGTRKATPEDKAAIEELSGGIVSALNDWDEAPSTEPARPKARFVQHPDDPSRLLLLRPQPTGELPIERHGSGKSL